jgi:DNA primase
MANTIKATGFDRSQIEEIKSRISIEDIISRYVRLKPSGKNLFGLCPFHKEDTPSFSVNPELQIYKCFGCGEGGDVFNFLQKIENIEFYEAMQQLADESGIKLQIKKQDPQTTQKFVQIKEAHKLAAKLYHNLLVTHKLGIQARSYLKNRKIDDKAIEEFYLGYAPSADNSRLLINSLIKKGYKKKDLVDYGLAIEKSGQIRDKFVDRLVFPIFDRRGNIIAFSGRIIEKNSKRPKYLNSPETILFQKRRNLFGYYQARQSLRKTGYMILVEGQTDVISSWQAGIKNIVAPLGTGLTDQQLDLIKKSTQEIILAFDTDRAGLMAIMRAAELALKKGMNVFAAKIKYGKDADECIKKDKNLWLETIEDRVPVVTFFLDIITEKYDPQTLDGKKTIIEKISPLMTIIRDPVIKEHHIKEISMITGINQDILQETFAGNITADNYIDQKHPQSIIGKRDLNIEIYLLTLIIQYSKQLKSKLKKINTETIQNENVKKAVEKAISQINNKKDVTIGKIQKDLDEDSASILQDSAMRPLWTEEPSISDLNKEFDDAILKIKISHLKSQITQLRNKLSLSEKQGKTKKSNEILNQINILIENLDKLTRSDIS